MNPRTRHRLRQLTSAEWSVIGGFGIVLLAILFSSPQWVADGSTYHPVRVIAFDADSARPIPSVRVSLFRAPPISTIGTLEAAREYFDSQRLKTHPATAQGTTGVDGTVVVNAEIRTSSSDKNPTSRAHLSCLWVRVEADGYSGVVLPVRHESQPVSNLRERGEIVVPVGMIRQR